VNLDFKIPLSGRVARKLAYASTIMKLDVDAKIIRHIDDDLLTSDEIDQHVKNINMNAHRTQIGLGVIQFVADCNYRAMVGTETEDQNKELLLLSALASGKNLLIMDNYKVGGKSSRWEQYLTKMNIPFIDGSNAQDGIDLSARIILASEKSNIDYLLKQARDRVFVYSHHIDQSFMDMDSLFEINNTQNSFNLYDMCQDFEFTVMGFYTVDHTGKSKQEWHSSLGFSTLASCLFSDNKLAKAISTERHSQKLLNESGIMLTSPHHIAKMLNINVDVLREKEAVYDDWNDHWNPAASQD
jgi:hypothetical protein